MCTQNPLLIIRFRNLSTWTHLPNIFYYLPLVVVWPPCFLFGVKFLLGLRTDVLWRSEAISEEEDIALELIRGLCPASLLELDCECESAPPLPPLWWLVCEERDLGALSCNPLSSSESEELESEVESSETRPPPENSSLVDWLSTSYKIEEA